jgi:phage protein D
VPIRTPYLQVKLEGQDVTRWVNSVSVVEDDHQADNVAISIPDPRMVLADGIFEGSVAEVDLGYAEANQHALMIRAMITKVELTYPESGVPGLTLKGEDKSIEMGLSEKKKLWKDRKLSEVVQEVARPYNFRRVVADLQPDPKIKSPTNQDGKTDLAFLQELAQTYHAKCFVELDEDGQEVLYFLKERRIVTLRRPDRLVLSYRMGPSSNLVSFSPSFDGSYIDRLKEVSDIDKKGRQVESKDKPPPDVVIWPLDGALKGRASAEDFQTVSALYALGVQRKRDLQQKLSAARPDVGRVAVNQADVDATTDTLEARRLGMSATGSTYGNIWLRAKSNVVIDGVHERFRGEWYVSSVTHKIDGIGYKTDFKCVR